MIQERGISVATAQRFGVGFFPGKGMRDLEKEARVAKRGLWADPKPVPPWEWRRAAAVSRR
jgi:endonuclease YncB( thermonuclease family)